MRNLLILLACWACAGHGRRVHTLLEKLRSGPAAERQTQLTLRHINASRQVSALEIPIPQTFARFLLALHPAAAAFAYSGPGIPFSYGSSRTFSSSVVPNKLPEVLCSRRNPTPWMIAAKEVFREYYQKTDWLAKTVMNLPAIVPNLVVAGTVLGTGSAGFIAPLSKRMLVKIVGAYIFSKFGFKLGDMVQDARDRAVIPAIARVLSKESVELNEEVLEQIASKCDSTLPEVEVKLGDLYLIYLQACLQSDSIDAAELRELLSLKKTLKISSAKVGQQVFKAAQQITGTDAVTKFTFLAERILSEDESQEGYEYDSKRAQKRFQMTQGEWKSIAEEVAVPFYQRAVNSAVAERKPCTARQLEAVRDFFRIGEERAEQIQVAELCNSVSSALSLSGKFSKEDKEFLKKARSLFGGSATLGNSVRDLTLPLYAETFNEVIGSLDVEPDEEFYKLQSGKLNERLDDLLLDRIDVEEVQKSTIRLYVQARLRGMNRVHKEGNLDELYQKMQSFMIWSKRLSKFMAFHHADPSEEWLKFMGFADTDEDKLKNYDFEDKLKHYYFEDSNRGQLSQSEAYEIWQCMVKHYLEDKKLDQEQQDQLDFMHTFLDLKKEQTEDMYERLASPYFFKEVEAVMDSPILTQIDPSRIQTVAGNLALPSSVTDPMVIQAYSTRARTIAGENRTLTDEQAASLESLRGILNLDMEKVHSVHEGLFGVTYCNAVKELIYLARNYSISEEMYEDLKSDQERLGISEASARDLYEMIAQDCYVNVANEALVQLNVDLESQYEDDEAFADDIKPFGKMVLNLVEMVDRTRGFYMKEVDGEMVEAVAVTMKGVMKLESSQQLLGEYLKEVYSTTNETMSTLLFNSFPRLKLLLGHTPHENQYVQNEIADLIFEQYLQTALEKGRIDSDDRAFLYSIADDLTLSKKEADSLLRMNEIARCRKAAERVFSKEDFEGQDVTELIELADTFDIKLKDDMEINSFELETMLEVQLEEVLAPGNTGPEVLEQLQFVAENLQIEEEDAEKMVCAWIQEAVDSGINEAYAMWQSDHQEIAVNDLLNLGRMGSMAETFNITQATPVIAEEREKLYTLFQRNKPYGLSKEEHQARQGILRYILLSDVEEVPE